MANEKSICLACKAEIEGTPKFCPECGANLEELRKVEELRKAEETRKAEEARLAQEAAQAQSACKCPKCGADVAENTKFCPECGTNIEEAKKTQSVRYCLNCGTKLEPNTAFCSECGTNQNTESFQQTQQGQTQYAQSTTNATENTSSDSDELLMRAYITGTTDPHSTAHNYEHYKNAFTKFSTTGSKIFWSWAGFWLNAWNLIARRNYPAGIIILVVWEVVSLLGLFNGNGAIPALISVLIAIGFGCFTDYLHYSRYHEKLAFAKSYRPNDFSAQISYMAENGGCSAGKAWIAFAVYGIYTFIIALYV